MCSYGYHMQQVVVKNTFLDIVAFDIDCAESTRTRCSSCPPRIFFGAEHKDFRRSQEGDALGFTSDASTVATSSSTGGAEESCHLSEGSPSATGMSERTDEDSSPTPGGSLNEAAKPFCSQSAIDQRPDDSMKRSATTLGLNALDLQQCSTRVPVSRAQNSGRRRRIAPTSSGIQTPVSSPPQSERTPRDEDFGSTERRKVELCSLICSSDGETRRNELSSKAPSFQPNLAYEQESLRLASMGALLGEIGTVVADARLTLLQQLQVRDVEMNAWVDSTRTGYGSSLTVEVSDDSCSDLVLELAQHALIEAASRSSSVYVLGYLSNAFGPTDDGYGFEASLAFLPPQKKDSACWDSYQRGFCPRCQNCRWYHPTVADLAQITVHLRASHP